MEGNQVMSTKLKFVECRKKFRVSSQPILSSYKLVTSANNHGWVIIGFEDNSVKAVPITQLLDFSSTKDRAEIQSLNQFSFTHQLDFKPTLLTVARYGFSSLLLICGNDEANSCPAIEVFDLDTQSSLGRINLNEVGGSEIIDYAWHPNYYDSIVALCTNRGGLLVVAIDKKTKAVQLVYNNQQYGALTCCWSPKGKNLAIGMSNNRIMRLEPVITATSFAFKEVDKSTLTFSHPNITPDHQVIKLRWVNKTYLLSVHAKPNHLNGPDTIYSIITVKPSKPYLYWKNVCYESQVASRYIVHVVNLSNSVICASTASSEASVIGVDGANEAKSNDLKDWNSIIIDEEGARIELPLDANNRETYPLGLTVAIAQEKPVIIFYTNDGVICPYAAMHNEDILKIPEFQQSFDCPMTVQKQNYIPREVPKSQDMFKSQNVFNLQDSFSSPDVFKFQDSFKSQDMFTPKDVVKPQELTKQPEIAKPQEVVKPPEPPQEVNKSQEVRLPNFVSPDGEIKAIREKLDYNQVFLGLLDDINHLRTKFEEIQEIHTIHKEVLDAVREDLDSLDLGMLENLHLIEYIKTRKNLRKKFQDPSIYKKVETMKKQFKIVEQKLVELEINVEVSWEEYVRRSGLEKKKCNLDSLDIIYKNLANNFKIIKILQKKLAGHPPPPKSPENYYIPTDRKELDPARMAAFKEFLSSRNVVPVRRPFEQN